MTHGALTSARLLVIVLVVMGLLVLVLVAAVAVLRLQNLRTARRWAERESRWTKLLLDVLAGDAPRRRLWDAVPAREALPFVNFLTRFAKRVRGDEYEQLRELARPFLPHVVRSLRSRNDEVRTRAVQTLGLIDRGVYAAVIASMLDDPSPRVVLATIRALSRQQRSATAVAVLACLRRFERWNSDLVAQSLAAFGNEAAPVLRAAFADRRVPPTIRVAAGAALSRLNDLEAGDVAASLLSEDDDREVTIAALRVLAQVGRQAHLPIARTAAVSRDEVVRAQAIRAIGRCGDKEDIRLVCAALDDPSPWVAVHAGRALAELNAWDVLREVAASDGAQQDAIVAREILSQARSA